MKRIEDVAQRLRWGPGSRGRGSFLALIVSLTIIVVLTMFLLATGVWSDDPPESQFHDTYHAQDAP
jgi:hypothetical protein